MVEMKSKVYVETSVIGHLTSRLQNDVTVRSHQETTREWWRDATDRFIIVAFRLVAQECARGDKVAGEERSQIVADLTLLPTTHEAEDLADALISHHAVPETEPEDALHIAIAAVNGIEYLVTWNFRHIANAVVRTRIESVCRKLGYAPPVICTPEELMEVEP